MRFIYPCLILVGGLVLSCGKPSESHPTGTGEETAEADATAGSEGEGEGEGGHCSGDGLESGIRLKGVGLLARTYADVLGPGKDVSVTDGDERLFQTYRTNFGGNEGLGYGEIYADNYSEDQTMSAYFMALNYLAYNAAMQCESGGRQGPCRCDDQASAGAMLERAIPWASTCGEQEQMAGEFLALCQQNYVRALTSLMSSVAIAKRN